MVQTSRHRHRDSYPSFEDFIEPRPGDDELLQRRRRRPFKRITQGKHKTPDVRCAGRGEQWGKGSERERCLSLLSRPVRQLVGCTDRPVPLLVDIALPFAYSLSTLCALHSTRTLPRDTCEHRHRASSLLPFHLSCLVGATVAEQEGAMTQRLPTRKAQDHPRRKGKFTPQLVDYIRIVTYLMEYLEFSITLHLIGETA